MSIETLFERKAGEKVFFSLRRHPLTFLKHIGFFLLMAVLPPIVTYQFFGGKIDIANPLLQIGGVLLAGAYYLVIWLFFFSQFTDYYLDIAIVTGERIIDNDQHGLFGRSVSEMNLSRIQDVRSEIKGIIPSIFNYGLVIVETAGEEKNFRFEQIANPHHVRAQILELAAKDREKEGAQMVEEALTNHKS
jgi:uncharacterized membrane protein YdbT with pleckstrin-like domain